ncbi:uncharacterized protein XM38_005950 [Halomicronema hongdechloris C2206]|uniref:Methionine synthase n=1 Tax=Halomicronema hongdechloris C2206 TaxID=1641165 RepID=A0A1Z3HH99_9CYAN|nr:Npun_R2821/Npun_R2822 family protein [Halomicronema hongdechloris]ASC69666.1 uncharacterized protein XM38_005950 [Halomicronema hongdechloris C2206]
MVKRGVYIVANDRVADNAIALLSSLRQHDPDLPVILIPFDRQYQTIAALLERHYQTHIFPDLGFLEQFTQTIADIFPRDFLKLPNKMRKLAVWFGPLEHFLYIDTDIITFQPLSQTLDFLQQADFICCDYHWKGRGLAEVFSPTVPEQALFSDEALGDVFNSGFWGSKRGLFTLDQMTSLLQECADHREYFDFSSGTTDQPIMNFLVLKAIERRLNITKVVSGEPGSWAGSSHFSQVDHRLYDGDRPLRYLHWAGTPMRPGGPYWDLWHHYRFLSVTDPLFTQPATKPPTLWQRLRRRLT